MTKTIKELIGLCWIQKDRRFYNDHSGEPQGNLIPIGGPTTIRRSLSGMAEDIGNKAPKHAKAYCIGWSDDQIYTKEGEQMVPIQYFTFSK
ncbi:MAG: hypothetical protein NTY20_03070 [Candidatus Aenigmarchaeota archaeon]|nr:hypothetical protein [Candidatus Aenigmarchaeota archaeon]